MGTPCYGENCKKELAEVPTIDSCPADNVDFFVCNAQGGFGKFGYAKFAWSTLVACLKAIIVPVKLPLTGIVGNGGANDPVQGLSVFQNNALIGLGGSNSRIQIFIDDVPMSNFGQNASFIFNPLLGEIDISPNRWVNGSSLYINLNQ